MKYTSLQQVIFDVFGSTEWKSNNIQTFPSNFIGDVSSDYIRVSVITNGDGRNSLQSGHGVINIDIFSAIGLGTLKANQIADKLDEFLERKTMRKNEYNLQTVESSLQHLGACKSNPSLHQSNYSIPFNYFGVF